ncbi:MAG: NADP-dependent oxidoreductase [Proteobacteria bacterium]|nr:NADP-dependent oxidoreductase [Pseudomonadota bacterium]
MQAAAIDHAGEATGLTVHTLPVPRPAAGEVLIALHTAGVASWDVETRRRPDMLTHARMPLVLGTDGSGTIAALGPGVTGFKVGEQVYTYSWDNPQGGFYAEYVAVPAERVGRLPKGMSLTDAGAIATTALTAQQGIDDALKVRRGESVLIHGAAGGVGTLAVQFAHLRGARVLATVSAPDEADLVKSLGADVVVDGRHDDLAAAARAFAPQGLDAVLVLAAGAGPALATLKPPARIAYPSGVHPEPQGAADVKVIRYDAIPGPGEFARLNAAIEAVRLRVPIAARFPLAQAAAAQQRLEAGHVVGKVILEIRTP